MDEGEGRAARGGRAGGGDVEADALDVRERRAAAPGEKARDQVQEAAHARLGKKRAMLTTTGAATVPAIRMPSSR